MKTKAGFFGIGLDAYWPQFEGLLENLKVHDKSSIYRNDNNREFGF